MVGMMAETKVGWKAEKWDVMKAALMVAKWGEMLVEMRADTKDLLKAVKLVDKKVRLRAGMKVFQRAEKSDCMTVETTVAM